jgi:hypothetical protein
MELALQRLKKEEQSELESRLMMRFYISHGDDLKLCYNVTEN